MILRDILNLYLTDIPELKVKIINERDYGTCYTVSDFLNTTKYTKCKLYIEDIINTGSYFHVTHDLLDFDVERFNFNNRFLAILDMLPELSRKRKIEKFLES